MKKRILFILAIIATFQLNAQDTTWVQTFTFDSIETRRADFEFPSSLDDKRFEKVLMYYKLKCSPLTTWDQYNCGEWDYLTYTRIFDHTGVMDSVRVDGKNYKVNQTSPNSYSYANSPYYNQQWKAVQNRTQSAASLFPVSGTGAAPLTLVSSGINGKTIQWVIPASELAASGVTAGDLQGLQLNLTNMLASLQGVKIRIKSTVLGSLATLETTGFTTVYENTLSGITAGLNSLNFSAPFVYDGTSNLIIELSYTDAREMTASVDLNMIDAPASANSLVYDNVNGVFVTTAANYAEVNLNNVDMGADLTIEFWSKGNGNTGQSTSILEAVDSLNRRILNIHMPWSDNTVYWDAGSNGSGSYDRISKAATVTEMDNVWHHWAFVKKSSTGQMFIYKDGVQWHSGTNLNLPVGKITKFILGSNIDQGYQWRGSIDEFSVWSSALDAATIAAWKDKKIDATHPDYASLETYYDFDGQLAMMDRSGNNRLGMCSDLNMIQNMQPVVAGTVSVDAIPEVSLIQGTMNAVTNDSVLVAQFPETSVVYEYEVGTHSFHISNNYAAYTQGTFDTLNVAGSIINSGSSIVDATLALDTITYYQAPFEVVNDVEIGRYITPYGIGFDLGPQGFAWIYDVTDYQKYLSGVVDLAAHNTQELIDLKFAFIEGIPPRDVHNIEPVWKNWTSYNYAEMANDVVLQATPVILSDTSSMFKLKTRLSGHGQVGNGACCEWQDKHHKIMLDGVERFNWSIWQTNECGENPNIKQGGTWPYAREGWCPGDMVKEYDQELTPFVTPGDTVLIDYDIDDVPANDAGQAGGNYVTAIDMVSYSAANFAHDAALVDVLNPNNYEYYSKFNPTCSNPRVIIQNTGSEPLTSVKLAYWVTSDYYGVYTWTGNLGFLEKEVVELPVTDQMFWFGAAVADGFTAKILEIEGAAGVDGYAQNNEFKTKYTAPETVDHHFYAWYKTNNKAIENKWRLIDGAGNTIFERTTLTNTTEYKDTFDLAPGCYSIIIDDSDDDGLSFWYSAQVEGETAGFFRIREVGGSIVETFPGDFGSYHRYDFTVGFTLNTGKNEMADEFMVFPNPSFDKIRVEYVGNLGEELTVEILDLNGRVIQSKITTSANYAMGIDFDINDLHSGMYIVRLLGGKGSRTTQFVKQ